MNEKQGTEIGGSMLGTLFLIFLVLKLAGLIDWSWWWVFSPFWVPVVVVVGVVVVVVLAAIVEKIILKIFKF